MLPAAFLERMEKMLGDEYGAFLDSFGGESFRALRLNPLKVNLDGESAAEKYGLSDGPDTADGSASPAARDAGFASLNRVPWAENGYYYGAEDQPGRHPFHEAGVYYIQEPSAMAPAELLGVRPGERVLDLCAAPGGKSTQLAAKLKGRGLLICNEIHPARAKILSENIERMGIVNACVTNEPPDRLRDFFPGYFHRILVDAPCSGEGMFRKNQAACEEWSPENVRLCAERQGEILDCAADMLLPGGRLVYSTCTFAPEENEGSVSRFLRRHEDFVLCSLEKEKYGWAGCDGVDAYAEEPDRGMENTLRLMPHRVRGEGHFAAVLKKRGELPGDAPEGPEAWDFAEASESAGAAGRTSGRAGVAEASVGAGAAGRTSGRAGVAEASEKTGARYAGRRESDKCRRSAAGARQRQESEAEEFLRFCRETFLAEDIRDAVGGPAVGTRYLRFGDSLYLVSSTLPDLKGLRVLRPGLQLGEFKKGRFEPSHALALAALPSRARWVWKLGAEAPETRAYLSGQTFSAEGEKGWYLICVEGFGLGWGKLAGGIMKNHYPKGLRVIR